MLTKSEAKRRTVSPREESPGLQRRGTHAVWIGPLITLAGAISYFTFFFRFPALRDFPWLNLPLVLLGVGCSALGWRQSWRARRWSGKFAGAIGLGVSLAIATLFTAYVFVISTWLPPPSTAAAPLTAAPSFRLNDHLGRAVALEDYLGRKVVVVFYRGFW